MLCKAQSPGLDCLCAMTLQLKDEMKETEGLKHFQVSKSLVDNHLFCVCEGARGYIYTFDVH